MNWLSKGVRMDAHKIIEAMSADEYRAAAASADVQRVAEVWRLMIALDGAADVLQGQLNRETRPAVAAMVARRQSVQSAVDDLRNRRDAFGDVLDREMAKLTGVQQLLVEEAL